MGTLRAGLCLYVPDVPGLDLPALSVVEMNPYRLPNDPALTIQEVLVWIHRKKVVTLPQTMEHFGISRSNAGVRLMKLHRWGYLKRLKPDIPPRIYHYHLTRFGIRQAKKWRS